LNPKEVSRTNISSIIDAISRLLFLKSEYKVGTWIYKCANPTIQKALSRQFWTLWRRLWQNRRESGVQPNSSELSSRVVTFVQNT
jgi:hypothetical protein